MLFVAAHWDELPPTARFTLVLSMVAVFHLAGALSAEKYSALATTFHGIGTASLGGAIFLSAQIFNLHENWATGVLLWAIGAVVGYAYAAPFHSRTAYRFTIDLKAGTYLLSLNAKATPNANNASPGRAATASLRSGSRGA